MNVEYLQCKKLLIRININVNIHVLYDAYNRTTNNAIDLLDL